MRMEKAATEKRSAELAKPQPQREKRPGRMGAFFCLTHFACSRCALLLGADIGLLWATKLRQRLGSFKGLDLQRLGPSKDGPSKAWTFKGLGPQRLDPPKAWTLKGLDLQRLGLQRLGLQRLGPSKAGSLKGLDLLKLEP